MANLATRQFTAEGACTVQRLRQGNNIYLSFANLSGKPLYQVVDDSGKHSPDWSGNSNDPARPVIAPQVSSMLGTSVVVENPQWAYNCKALTFSVVSSPTEWAKETVASGTPRFAYRAQDMAIKPIENLADAQNPVNGQLTFSAEVVADGGRHSVQKSIDVVLAKAGASAYNGFLVASNITLDEAHTSTDITATLFSKGTEVVQFWVKWYKDKSLLKSTGPTGNGITVTRGQVDSMQLYSAEFYLDAAMSTPVAYAGVTVIDTADQFDVVFEYLGNPVITDSNPSVKIKARLLSEKTGKYVTQNVAWMMDVIDPETFKSIKSSNTDTIEVTTAETDRMRTINGQQTLMCTEVTVIAKATWGLNFSVPTSQILQDTPYYRQETYTKGEYQMAKA